MDECANFLIEFLYARGQKSFDTDGDYRKAKFEKIYGLSLFKLSKRNFLTIFLYVIRERWPVNFNR